LAALILPSLKKALIIITDYTLGLIKQRGLRCVKKLTEELLKVE
jgi:hypothetical protein